MINYIWGFFIVLGVLFSIINGSGSITNSMLSSGSKAIDMILGIVPLMCLWLGTMKIAEEAGLLDIISHKLSKVVKIFFPERAEGDKAIGYISSNVVMNMLGLGNAATPFGLKAMKELQRLNNTTTASRSMITFLVINTSSVTIIPTTVISIRILNNSINPTSIVPLTIITTFISTFLALVLDRLFYILWRKRND